MHPATFGNLNHLEKLDPLFGFVSPEQVCAAAVEKNYGAKRLATALVLAIEAKDLSDNRDRSRLSTLAAGLRELLESGAY